MLSNYCNAANSFTYNGVNSLDMGLFIMKQSGADNAAKPVIETINVPARGNFIIDNRIDELDNQQFNDYARKYVCCVDADAFKLDLEEHARRLYAWLYGSGIEYKKLYDTYDRDYYTLAYVSSGASVSELAKRLLGQIEMENVALCDTVTVRIDKLQIEATAKIVKVKYDSLKEHYDTMEIGSVRTNLTKQLTATQQEVTESIKKNQTRAEQIKKQIEQTIADTTAAITGNSGGYVVLYPEKNPQEIYILDQPELSKAKNVWRWNLAGLGHSSTGVNGKFTTAITADGQIVADFITAGELTGAILKAGTVYAEALDVEYRNAVTKYADDAANKAYEDSLSKIQTTAEEITLLCKKISETAMHNYATDFTDDLSTPWYASSANNVVESSTTLGRYAKIVKTSANYNSYIRCNTKKTPAGTYRVRYKAATIAGQENIARVQCSFKTTGMWDRNAMYVDSKADGFTAENLTIENSYKYTNGNDQQADALCIVADKTACVNVRLVGYQDTLLTDSRVKGADGNYEVTRQYFSKCYITGNVDFIYGAGTSYFDDCDIVARYTEYKADGCFTAGRTYASTDYGYVFNNCRFLAEDKVLDDSYRMARPWGKDDSTTFINCYLGRAIVDLGYGDMSGNSYKNARFAEYGSYGPGYVLNSDRPLLTSIQAEGYTLKNVLGDYDAANMVKSMYGVKIAEAENPSETPSEEKPSTEIKEEAEAPQTGDKSPIAALVSLLGLSGLGIFASTKKKRV